MNFVFLTLLLFFKSCESLKGTQQQLEQEKKKKEQDLESLMKLVLAKEEKIEKLSKDTGEKQAQANEQKGLLEEKEKQIVQLNASLQRLKDRMNQTLKEQVLGFKGTLHLAFKLLLVISCCPD